ncbi:MAG: hypothetical protein SFW36_04470 [Leptolyngbyaceae cyanobacterium bins.59]|nr:hypothetical protein [Leptolyngbyaceae cyanobacterium bins.59]
MSNLSFITLLSYDYRYAYSAIRSYYELADEIILGLDKDRLTWSGNQFEFDLTGFETFLNQYDHAHKIRLVEDNFHPLSSARENDTRERNYLSYYCQGDNWIIQIDADEILLNPLPFQEWMLTANPEACIYARWISVFKVLDEFVLAIDPPIEYTAIGIKTPGLYTDCRETSQPRVVSPLNLLHFSWGRSEAELLTKLQNWSHNQDFDIQHYFEFWKSVNAENYASITNFHPIDGPAWQRLVAVPFEMLPAGRELLP